LVVTTVIDTHLLGRRELGVVSPADRLGPDRPER
jgi:hypothetical protein